MTQLDDYYALAATLLYAQPKRIFEIGTFLGVTSDFFLELLPDCEVVSIAYVRSFLGKKYNNTNLSRDEVGSLVSAERRSRFHQLPGDSHKLKDAKLTAQFGKFDMLFIDGDHCREGVRLDTELAQSMLAGNADAAISWHDANPKQKYMPVRHYLEQDLQLTAIATKDDDEGGVATWTGDIESLIP